MGIQFSNGLVIEQIGTNVLLIIGNQQLFQFLWHKFAIDFGHARFMSDASDSASFKIQMTNIEPHVLQNDLQCLDPNDLNQYV